jgi:hypothetical protein
MLSMAVIVAAFGAGWNGVGIAILVSAVLLLAYLIAVAAATRTVSVLGGTSGLRVLWALLVLTLGSVGWLLGWIVSDEVGLGISHNALLTLLLGGVPFALVAGLFLSGWRYRSVAAGVIVLLMVAGIVALRRPAPGELDTRLALAGMTRETSYAVAIPGYRPDQGRDFGHGFGGASFSPVDPAAVPPDRLITLTAYDEVVPSEQMCGQPSVRDPRLGWGSCAVEADGLVYRSNELVHGYLIREGAVWVAVDGTPAVDRDALRAAARSLHPATAEELHGRPQNGELYAATIPGYVQQEGSVDVYEPVDGTGSGARSVSIQLSVAYAGGDTLCMPPAECTPDGNDLTYVRKEDMHGYVARRGKFDVTVMGGMRVDRALLRQAAVAARPATDAELSRVVPPLRPSRPVDYLRQLLRGN